MPVSPALKPEPVTVMESPGAALAGLIKMPTVTAMVIVAEVEEPSALMVWEPGDEAGTVKVALQPPRELAEIPEATSVPS